MTMGSLIGQMLLPIISAFLFITMTPIWKFHSKKVDARRFVFWVLVGALALSVISGLFLLFLESKGNCPAFSDFKLSLIHVVEGVVSFSQRMIPNMGVNTISALSLFISLLSIMIFAMWKFFFLDSYGAYYTKRKIHATALARETDSELLSDLFLHSIDQLTPIMVNLKGGKVYIGWVIADSGYSDSKENAVSLFLLASGYRDPETLEFKLVNNYTGIINQIIKTGQSNKLKEYLEFGHTILVREIVSATPWVADIYEKVKGSAKPKKRAKAKKK